MRNNLARRALLPAALVIAALLTGGQAGAASAGDADAVVFRLPSAYQVEVVFDEVTFHHIDDCDGARECGKAEMYGFLWAQRSGAGFRGTGARNIGAWENSAACSTSGGTVAWGEVDDSECPVAVVGGHTYLFGSHPLCTTADYAVFCGAGTPAAKNNNRVVIEVRPGDQIFAAVHTVDYDTGSGDDDLCRPSGGNVPSQPGSWTGPYATADLANLNEAHSMSQYFNGDGSCTVNYHLRTIGTIF